MWEYFVFDSAAGPRAQNDILDHNGQNQGWELVAVIDKGDFVRFYMKRPMRDEGEEVTS